MIDNGRRVAVRYDLPLPVGVWLGAPVRMTVFGVDVSGIVTGIYRAKPDPEGWRGPGVLIEAMPLS